MSRKKILWTVLNERAADSIYREMKNRISEAWAAVHRAAPSTILFCICLDLGFAKVSGSMGAASDPIEEYDVEPVGDGADLPVMRMEPWTTSFAPSMDFFYFLAAMTSWSKE